MAEIDFDDEDDDLDVDNPDDGEDPAETADELLDEDDDDIDDASGSGFFSRRRIIIIAAVIGVVFIAVALIFGLGLFNGSSSPKIGADGKPVQEKRKPKKKVKYEDLYTQLTPEQMSDVIKQLSFESIYFKTTQTGNSFTVEVDEDELERARALLAIKGLPAGGSQGYELLDQSQTLGVTEFDKRVRFLRALSGELEKAIIQFDAIETAKVQVVLPEQRLFAVTQPPVTASILIRKAPGVEVTDDHVFSIIMLVSKAVENLQPENVSVIDTEGMVLSTGIFERMAAREAGLLEEEAVVEEPIFEPVQEYAEGIPIVPEYQSMKKWIDMKRKFERGLEDKAIKQLFGVLPFGSFKLAITADIGPLDDGEVIDVKRLTTSIVINTNHEEIYFDQILKDQVFKTIAGAIGYVRGRDTIQLSTAETLTFSDEEMARFRALQKGDASVWPYILGLLALGGLGALYVRYKRKKPVDDTPFGDSVTDGPPQLAIGYEQGLARIRDIAETNPDILAEIMEGWLSAETQTEEELVDA